LRQYFARGASFVMMLCAAVATLNAPAAEAADPPRIEARSKDLLAIGVVSGEKMSIRVNRLIDNAPLQDAVVAVVLRGERHATVAEADGSYTFSDKDLALPGAAAIDIRINQRGAEESLKGTLNVGPGKVEDDKGNARQMWWWALNFGVCIGFLWLISRRKKKAEP
jgi:hypothetical protein